MALSPAQRHSQRIAMEQKLKRSRALETTESMHLLVKALETDVGHVRSLPTIADRIEFKGMCCCRAGYRLLKRIWKASRCTPIRYLPVCYLAV